MANRREVAGKKVIVAGKPNDSRAGKRRDRNKRVGARVPELGYYLIATDTEETEKNYFEGLRDSIPAELKDRLVIKVEKARTVELVRKALEMTGQKYFKNDKDVYRKLVQHGDEKKALYHFGSFYKMWVIF